MVCVCLFFVVRIAYFLDTGVPVFDIFNESCEVCEEENNFSCSLRAVIEVGDF